MLTWFCYKLWQITDDLISIRSQSKAENSICINKITYMNIFPFCYVNTDYRLQLLKHGNCSTIFRISIRPKKKLGGRMSSGHIYFSHFFSKTFWGFLCRTNFVNIILLLTLYYIIFPLFPLHLALHQNELKEKKTISFNNFIVGSFECLRSSSWIHETHSPAGKHH